MIEDRTLVQIRERSFLDLLDLALMVVRRRPLAVGLAALAGVAPFAALNALIMSSAEVPYGLWWLLIAWEAPWATAPLTVVLGGLMFGERPRVGQVARAIARGLPAMILYQGALRALLLVTCVGLPVVAGTFGFLDEVILLEKASPGKALRRALGLSADRWVELFLQWTVQVAFGLIFVFCFRLAAGKVVDLLLGDLTWLDVPDIDEWAYWRAQLLGWRVQAATWLAIAFFGVARFLTYIDQRIRLEGWEVELRLRAAGAALEDAGRW